MAWAVRFEEVSKWYRGTGWRYASLRHDLSQIGRKAVGWLRRRRRAPNGRLVLDRLSFEVEQGEAFGVIGPNGAGKTTALKLLTRISYPTAGSIRVRGRIGALIEVGSGIHPELTGRENIWLYGRIMGMSRRDIARRFDEIVEFAELGHVLDQPVKRYSSGMQLRLGFSIASHLEPDVFVVDEALSVGDAAFRARCVDRMTQLRHEGRTLLFVSHHLQAVETVCSRTLFLLDGRVETLGATRDAIAAYLDWVDTHQQARIGQELRRRPTRCLGIERVSFHDASGAERSTFRTGDDLEIRLHVRADVPVEGPLFSVGIGDGRLGGLILCSMLVDGRAPDVIDEHATVSCRIRRIPLLPRVYQVWCSVRSRDGVEELVDWRAIGAFRVTDGPIEARGVAALSKLRVDAPIHADYGWTWTGNGHAGPRARVPGPEKAG